MTKAQEIELLKEHATEFDKYLVSISSGGIVFILLFSKSIFDSTDWLLMPILGLVAVPLFFGVTILSVILSIYLSQKRYFSKIVSPKTKIDAIEKKIAIFNFLALTFFVSGFISSLFFGAVNIFGFAYPRLVEFGENYEPFSGLIVSVLIIFISNRLVDWVEPKPE